MSIESTIVATPKGPQTGPEWKKNLVQVPSRRTRGKDLPSKVTIRTNEK